MSKKVISTSSDTVGISSDSHIDIVASSGQTGMEENQSTGLSLENLNIEELYPYDENIEITRYLYDEVILNTMENDALSMNPSQKENAIDIITDSEEKVKNVLEAGVDASCKDIPQSKLCAEKLKYGSPLNLETVCNVCKEIFECIMELEDHYLIHEEFHEMYCRICHLKIDEHETRSEGKMHYQCCVCGYRLSKSALKRHLYIHSPLRLFQCEYCDVRFKQSVNLKTHVKKFHPEF